MKLASALIFVVFGAAQAEAQTVAAIPAQPTAPIAAPAQTPAPATDEDAPTPPPSPGAAAPTPPAAPPAVAVDMDAEIRAAYLNAENAQGPLDGRWRLTAADGSGLFAFAIADTGGAPSVRASTPSNPQIEGAWRDLRHDGAIGVSGILVSVVHLAGAVEIRFYESDPATPTVVKLHPDADGAWSGDLVEAGSSTPVTMKRF